MKAPASKDCRSLRLRHAALVLIASLSLASLLLLPASASAHVPKKNAAAYREKLKAARIQFKKLNSDYKAWLPTVKSQANDLQQCIAEGDDPTPIEQSCAAANQALMVIVDKSGPAVTKEGHEALEKARSLVTSKEDKKTFQQGADKLKDAGKEWLHAIHDLADAEKALSNKNLPGEAKSVKLAATWDKLASQDFDAGMSSLKSLE